MNHKKIYNIDKKYCFRVSLVYYLSVLFANFMAKLIPITVDIPVAYTADMLVWKNFIDSNEILITSLTIIVFLIPSIICIKDSLSILHAKEDKIKIIGKSETVIKKNINRKFKEKFFTPGIFET